MPCPTYTPADVAEAARDLAWLMNEMETEPDPVWRKKLAWWVADDAAWLARMVGEVG